MNRTLNVVRLQLVNRMTYIFIPLIVLGGAFAIAMLVFMILRSIGGEVQTFGGAAQAPLWYFAVVGVQALTLTFPFAQALSITRREFFFGTFLTAALASVLLAAVFTVAGLVEKATNGWGMEVYLFALGWVWDQGPLGGFAIFFALTMLFFAVGFLCATVYKRFGAMAIALGAIGFALALVGIGWLITIAQKWTEVGAWLGTLQVIGIAALVLALVAVLAAASFGILRRTVS